MGLALLPQHEQLAEQIDLKIEELKLDGERLTDHKAIRRNDKKILTLQSILAAYDKDMEKKR